MQLSLSFPSIQARSLRSMILLFILFYLSFHAISGERGIIAWFKANRELAQLEMELEKTKAKNEIMSKRVALLSGPEIDHDMLDEQARRVLGFARDNEIVVLQQQQ